MIDSHFAADCYHLLLIRTSRFCRGQTSWSTRWSFPQSWAPPCLSCSLCGRQVPWRAFGTGLIRIIQKAIILPFWAWSLFCTKIIFLQLAFSPKFTRFMKVVFVNFSMLMSPSQTMRVSLCSSWRQGKLQSVLDPLRPMRESTSKSLHFSASTLKSDWSLEQLSKSQLGKVG